MGDLTKRKLLPSLYNLRCLGLLPRDFAIVGFARRELDDEASAREMTPAIEEFATRPVDAPSGSDFGARSTSPRATSTTPEAFRGSPTG